MGEAALTIKAQYQQGYRQTKKNEKAALLAKVGELEKTLVRIRRRHGATAKHSERPASKDLLLPWKDVAKALSESAREALVLQLSLRKDLDLNREVFQRLATWMEPSMPWGVSNTSLARMPLVAHPEARRHGLDWLTQLVFHNTDAILDKYQFPPIDPTTRHHRPYFDILAHANADSSVSVVCQYMRTFDGAMDDVVRLVYQEEIQRKSYTGMTPDECASRRIDVVRPDPEVLIVLFYPKFGHLCYLAKPISIDCL
ncbi:hypothetical protein DYB30_008356 [Aphanomyces astaci]|uniref:Uncharacterized protein n=1 Tax=Aphanomyces astaci TaxID=112090 RepID=A0A397D7A5_APHAT|nr:hypothetical protein DYB30_008356 [Aphanomyces astaci]